MSSQILPTAAESLTGKVLAERYLVLGTLGTGAMGTVYKARHQMLDRDVAIKMLKREAAQDEVSQKRFENEARAAAALAHTHLITVTDFGFLNNGSPFLVMDYVEGKSLAAMLKQPGGIDDQILLTILTQICSGLAHAHDKGLIHRDLKPSNILVTVGDGGVPHVKIVDFGLAKPIVGDQDLTHTGQIFGTPLYMSPEQCQGRRLDARSDIYSLGCLMYRILAGKLPFTGDNPVATIVMHVKDAPAPIPDEMLTTEFRKRLATVIMRCLEKEPKLRPQNVPQLRNEIVAAWALRSVPAPNRSDQSGSNAAVSQPKKSRIPVGLNTLALVACLMLGIGSILAAVVGITSSNSNDENVQQVTVAPPVVPNKPAVAAVPVQTPRVPSAVVKEENALKKPAQTPKRQTIRKTARRNKVAVREQKIGPLRRLIRKLLD